MDKQNIGLIIPARAESTRLPNKPLLEICGKTMIQRTWDQCEKAALNIPMHVATNSRKILDHVNKFGGNGILVEDECATGTDRVARANKILGYDYVINVQGDEPIIDPQTIIRVFTSIKSTDSEVVNCMARICDRSDFFSESIPKVVVDRFNQLLYASRSAIPGSKGSVFITAMKQICVYGFSRQALDNFFEWGVKSSLESIEDIEILRFLENGVKVGMLEVDGSSRAVDTREDLDLVRALVARRETP